MVTDEQIAKWRKLANEATEGWQLDTREGLVYIPLKNPDAVFSRQTIIVDYSGQHIEDDMEADLRFIHAARTAVPALLDEVERHQEQIDNLGNDMAVIQDAIATGFWNIENIWLHIKTEEGDELARDVQQLWLELMWADFVRANAHDHWDGFKFTPPQPSEPVRFFSDEARKALDNEYPPS